MLELCIETSASVSSSSSTYHLFFVRMFHQAALNGYYWLSWLFFLLLLLSFLSQNVPTFFEGEGMSIHLAVIMHLLVTKPTMIGLSYFLV